MEDSKKQLHQKRDKIYKNDSQQIEGSKQIFLVCEKKQTSADEKINKQQTYQKEDKNINIIRYVIEKNKLTEKQEEAVGANQSQQLKILPNYEKFKSKKIQQLVKKLNGGVINDVYQVCQDYVIKIQNVIQGILIHQPQMLKLAENAGVKCPKLVDYGSFDNKNYLLMTKVQGERLWRFWPLLTQQQKQEAIKQICQQLKKLHSIKFDNYSSQRPQIFCSMYQSIQLFNENLKSMINQNKIEKLDNETSQNLRKLVKFVEENIYVFKQQQDQRNQAVFIHNDLHFGNILFDYNTKHITGLVDFDFSRQLTKDYELWHIVDVFHKPIKYVEEGEEPLWQNFKIQNQIKYFKKYYPQLFQDKHHKLCTKIKIYLFDEMVTMLDYGAIDLFNEKFYSYYQSSWLNDFLQL